MFLRQDRPSEPHPPNPGQVAPHQIPEPSDLPFVLKHVAFGVPGLDAETLCTVRNKGESNIGIFRNRNAAFHRQNQAVILPQPQFIDEEGREYRAV